jgi:hypothetical protein
MPASRHHPDGGASAHCDNSAIEAAITRYQTSRDLASLSQVVELTQRRADTLITFYRTTRYRSHDELISDINSKMLRAVDRFDPEKGSAFTFVSPVISNTLCTSVTAARRDLVRHRRLMGSDLNHLVTNSEVESKHAVEDIAYRVRSGVKTTIENSTERDVQRWLVDSFIDASFAQCRCACADAAMAVHGVNYNRSRELYDLTMLEVRRVLYHDIERREPICALTRRGRVHEIRHADAKSFPVFTSDYRPGFPQPTTRPKPADQSPESTLDHRRASRRGAAVYTERGGVIRRLSFRWDHRRNEFDRLRG